MKKFANLVLALVLVVAPSTAFAGPVAKVVKAPVKVAQRVAGVSVAVAKVPAKAVKAKPVRKVLGRACGCRACGC